MLPKKRKSKIQNLIDKLRGKKPTLKKIMQHNKINVPKKLLKRLDINIVGENNVVEIDESVNISGYIRIKLYGDNNLIRIKRNANISVLDLAIGQKSPQMGKANNTEFELGEKSSVGEMQYVTFNSGAKCIIGDNCMFAFDINFYNTDAHPVFDINTKEIINKVKEIRIGNHVWIGAHASILKNTQITDDCIVGWGSVVSGKHVTPHCAIAGNPAKKVKEGITWDPNGSNGYVQNVVEGDK